VRIIAATNKDLASEVRDGRFRMDLFYRLNVVSFRLPPLRERRDDIPALVDSFIERLRIRFNRPKLTFSANAKRQIMEHQWPGNIRELRNVLERSAALTRDDVIDFIEDLHLTQFEPNVDEKQSSATPPTLAELERRHILNVLGLTGGHRERAAVILGITSRTLYRKLAEYGV